MIESVQASELQGGDKIIATDHGEGGMVKVERVDPSSKEGYVVITTRPRTHIGEYGSVRRVEGPTLRVPADAELQRVTLGG